MSENILRLSKNSNNDKWELNGKMLEGKYIILDKSEGSTYKELGFIVIDGDRIKIFGRMAYHYNVSDIIKGLNCNLVEKCDELYLLKNNNEV